MSLRLPNSWKSVQKRKNTRSDVGTGLTLAAGEKGGVIRTKLVRAGEDQPPHSVPLSRFDIQVPLSVKLSNPEGTLW